MTFSAEPITTSTLGGGRFVRRKRQGSGGPRGSAPLPSAARYVRWRRFATAPRR